MTFCEKVPSSDEWSSTCSAKRMPAQRPTLFAIIQHRHLVQTDFPDGAFGTEELWRAYYDAQNPTLPPGALLPREAEDRFVNRWFDRTN